MVSLSIPNELLGRSFKGCLEAPATAAMSLRWSGLNDTDWCRRGNDALQVESGTA